ncbi:uncharacterized protein RCC_09810 [Ramularia collo-cygni]|uniref:Uncharacterized protein n=1 Tax=Ramularia collo-cygni TaxID=112498 RepID=A0A2D3V7X1_9PEZI|nr:uncharacterized protein RCC_09810 [Ramularia collo-cygni]CZT24093.1 uncharacterized protein RCC_09810 [Ramularia collo-cygni]
MLQVILCQRRNTLIGVSIRYRVCGCKLRIHHSYRLVCSHSSAPLDSSLPTSSTGKQASLPVCWINILPFNGYGNTYTYATKTEIESQ